MLSWAEGHKTPTTSFCKLERHRETNTNPERLGKKPSVKINGKAEIGKRSTTSHVTVQDKEYGQRKTTAKRYG